uniref:Uncharacterized protein n=1 Tax=viral metagenome TaxID=1070528 RepID=A0A6C0KD77_9ZZZZ
MFCKLAIIVLVLFLFHITFKSNKSKTETFAQKKRMRFTLKKKSNGKYALEKEDVEKFTHQYSAHQSPVEFDGEILKSSVMMNSSGSATESQAAAVPKRTSPLLPLENAISTPAYDQQISVGTAADSMLSAGLVSNVTETPVPTSQLTGEMVNTDLSDEALAAKLASRALVTPSSVADGLDCTEVSNSRCHSKWSNTALQYCSVDREDCPTQAPI